MASSVASCGIAAWGVVRSSLPELVHLRKNPILLSGKSPVSQLKLVDDQAVLATTAVLRAIDTQAWHDHSFVDWGVVSAPRYLGRLRMALTFSRYQRLGLPGVNPLAIPTMSLHAVAGTVGLILGSHGPNFGVGGGPNHLAEGLLTALAVLHDQRSPGVWLIATCFDPEPIPDEEGKTSTATVGYGVALALTASVARQSLRLGPSSTSAAAPAGTVPNLVEYFDQNEKVAATWSTAVGGGAALEITATTVTPCADRPWRLAG